MFAEIGYNRIAVKFWISFKFLVVRWIFSILRGAVFGRHLSRNLVSAVVLFALFRRVCSRRRFSICDPSIVPQYRRWCIGDRERAHIADSTGKCVLVSFRRFVYDRGAAGCGGTPYFTCTSAYLIYWLDVRIGIISATKVYIEGNKVKKMAPDQNSNSTSFIDHAVLDTRYYVLCVKIGTHMRQLIML